MTGMGVVSPWGAGTDVFWENLSRGRSAVRRLENPDLKDLPAGIAATVPGIPALRFDLELRNTRPRVLNMALAAAEEAWLSAKLQHPAQNHDKTALCSSVGWGPYEEADLLSIATSQLPADPSFLHRTQAGFGDAALQRHFRIRGPVFSCLSACAASTQALGYGCSLLQTGRADICLAGGADSRIHILGAAGYSLLKALATGWEHAPEIGSRPFDRNRNGFVMGEGAAFFILETLEHAEARGAAPKGEIAGHAVTCDAYRLTDPEPDGAGAASCIRLAIESAGLKPADIDYINAHGTGTPANDAAEVQALRRIFGDMASQIPISSFKSMFGHLSMASGAIEVAGTLLALKNGILPPTLNCDDTEWPELDFVPHKPRTFQGRIALKNSFGFGGQNACLVLKRFES